MKAIKLVSIFLVLGLLGSCEKEELPSIQNENESVNSPKKIKANSFISSNDNLNFTLQSSSNNMGGFAGQSMTQFKGNLWLVGGDNNHTAPWSSSSQVWASRNGTDWKLITKSPFAERRNHSLIVYKNKLWLIGGIKNNGEILSDIWNSSDGINWNQVNSLNPLQDIGQNSSVVFNERLFVFRGNGTENQEVWSSSNGSNWRLETDNAFPVRSHYKTLLFNGSIYVIGGWLRGGLHTNEIWASRNGRNWYKKSPASDIFAPRIDHSVTVYKGKVWVIGGQTSNTSGNRIFHGDIWYSDNMKYWTRYENRHPFQEGLHSHVILPYENKLWVFGGYNPDSSMADIITENIWSIN